MHVLVLTPIVGLSAKFIEQGGADLIIIYNSGRFRMAGRGSLAGLMPYGNANDVVLEMVHAPLLLSQFTLFKHLRLPFKYMQRLINADLGQRGPPHHTSHPRPSRHMRN
jgi:predicted TIM-barrel enzyme